MRKTLLLSIALVLCISLVAIGAVGNSKILTSSKPALKVNLAAQGSSVVAKKAATTSAINIQKAVPTEEVAVKKANPMSNLDPKIARYLEDHAATVADFDNLPFVNNNQPPNPPQIATTYINEGFENGGATPAGWTNSSSYPWIFNGGTSGYPIPGAAHSGSYAACYNIYSIPDGQTGELTSPVINLTGNGNYQLVFWSWDNTDPYGYSDYADVWYDVGSGFQLLYTIPNNSSGWIENVISFNATSTVQIKFIGHSNYGYTDPYVDDVIVRDIATDGRCCYGDPRTPECAVLSETDCANLGGTWAMGETCESMPCVPVPPNDQCEWVTPLTLVDGVTYDITGTVTGATGTNDCAGFAQYPNVWEGFIVDQVMNITITFCGNSPVWGNTWLNLAMDCPCSGFTAAGLYNSSECGDGNYTVRWSGVQPGTYFFPIMLAPQYNCNGQYTIHVTGTSLQVPANDLCADAIPVAIPSSTNGTTVDATIDAAPTCFTTITAPGVWYTVVGNGDSLSADVCSATWDTKMHVFCGSCENLVCVYGNDDACGTGLQSLVSWASVAGNTYYILVDGYSSNTGPFTLNVNDLGPYYGTPVDCSPAPPEADFYVTAPGQWTDGNLCNAGDNCNLRAGEDQIWQVTIPYEADWTFAFCNSPTAWDTYIYLGTSLCSADIGQQDDGCTGTFLSKATWHLTAGTYYLDVEAYSPGDCDVYTLDIYESVPCDLVMPSGAVPEVEDNGGCNSTPPVFDNVACGDTKSGTSSYDGTTRDTDWFLFTTTSDITVTLTFAAEFDGIVGIIVPYSTDPCDNSGSLTYYTTSSACDTVTLTTPVLPAYPGTYVLFVAPLFGNPFSDKEYWVTMTCEGAEPCVVTCPSPNTPENEPTCYDEYVDVTNGGCNSDPNVFGTVSFGETICGNAGTFTVGGAPSRDTDWFTLHVAQDTTVNVSGVGQMPFQLLLVGGDCANPVILGSSVSMACSTGTFSTPVVAGDYWVWAGPSDVVGVPCGSPYYFTVTASAPPPPPQDACLNAFYGNGAPDGGNVIASQCDHSYPFVGATADDFVLPGSGNVDIVTAVGYLGSWAPGGITPEVVTGVVITVYNDAGGLPGGQPIDGDPNCAHEGDVVYTATFTPDAYTTQEVSPGIFSFEIPLDPVLSLVAGTTYWFEFMPIVDYTPYGQAGSATTLSATGLPCMTWFPAAQLPNWEAVAGGDMAFCLLTAGGGQCDYTPGDINGNGTANGIDVVFGVNYFKGIGVPPVDCHPICVNQPNPFYAAGDVNGNCTFNGIDITFFVRYLKGQVPALLFCADCPPAPIAAPAVIKKAAKTTNQQ